MDSSDIQIESTLKYWPSSSQLRQSLSVPLTLSICPTSQQNNNASFNQKNLQKYRCQSCKAFINKFCLLRGQNDYDCSLCGFSNHVDEPISMNSAQMSSISYKCKASKIQRIIVNKQRVFVFILDFSNYDQISQKYLLYSIHGIRQFIKRAISQRINMKVMFLAFDDGIQLFSIKNQLERIVYWQQQTNKNVKQIPYNPNQLANINQCKDNIFTLLDVLEEEINQRKFKSNSSSKKIMEIIQYALKYTRVQSGKIFVVSGLSHEINKFKIMRNYDSTVQDALKNHYGTVKKHCLTEEIQNLVNSTQMSISIFFHNSSYINMMPLYIITKMTNGELRHYFKHQTEHFFYEFNYLLHQCLYQIKYETLLRVRTGSGLKLVGIFGNYRPWKGMQQQIETLSCGQNKKYIFEFIVQGKINTPLTVVQFSILYTDLNGNRYYKIITQDIQLSNDLNIILPGINYQLVNQTYLKAILHNMDITPYHNKLQFAFKERCKKHIKFIREYQMSKNQKNNIISNSQLFEPEYMKKVRNYAIFTFLLTNHIFMNNSESRDVYLDLNTEIKSKINTCEDSVNIFWPIIYVVNEYGHQIVQMKAENYNKGTIGIVVDRCDQIFLFIRDMKMRNSLKQSKNLINTIKQTSELQKIYELLGQIQQRNQYPHLDIFISDEYFMNSFNIFNWQGNNSFSSFIEDLLSN